MAQEEESAITTTILAVTIVFTVLAAIAVVARLFASRRAGGLYLDDWLALVTLFFCVCFLIPEICGAAIAGVNTTTLPLDQSTSLFLTIFWLDFLFVAVTDTLVKLSIVEFYKRLFPIKKFKYACLFVEALCVSWGIGVFFAQVFSNNPVDAAWNPPAKLTIDYPNFALAAFGIGIGLDVIVLALPIPMVSGLHMPLVRKFKVMAIFLLGLFCVVAASVRFYYSYEEVYVPNASLTYAGAINVSMWSRIEPNASLIAACLPLLGPIVPKMPQVDNMLHSVIAMISLRSRSSSENVQGGSRGSDKVPTGAKNPKRSDQYPLRDVGRDSNVSTSSQASHSAMDDIEANKKGAQTVDRTRT